MISRAAGVIATLLIAVPGCEVRAQIYLYPYPPPPASAYRAPADADDDGLVQVPYYRSPSRAWEPRTGTETNADRAPVQSVPRTGDPRYGDPRFSALPPEDRPETGPRKELPPQFRRTQVDYFTKEPAGTIVIDTPNTYLYLVLGNGKALRYGIGVGREGFTWSGAEKISRMAEWPDWNPPEQMIERQPYLPRFMAGGATNPLGARALYLGDTLAPISRPPSAVSCPQAASGSPTRTSPTSTGASKSVRAWWCCPARSARIWRRPSLRPEPVRRRGVTFRRLQRWRRRNASRRKSWSSKLPPGRPATRPVRPLLTG
jgi:lipoprotein-anchoring transpeptidase ErfK/SrfK